MKNVVRKDADGAEDVHRLVDMVVEEVSLVDRAANKQRFLIVKRDDAMDNSTVYDGSDIASTDGEPMMAPPAGMDEGEDDDGSPLGAAVEALECLTEVVELLGSTPIDQIDPALLALVDQLRVTTNQIVALTCPAPPSDPAGAYAAETVLARAKAAMRSPYVSRSRKAVPAVAKSIAALAHSFRVLSETVRMQQERLRRVEKQFGMPNSAASAERVRSAGRVDNKGWPFDLNQPKENRR